MRWLRLLAAFVLIPIVSAAAYRAALGWDGNHAVIDTFGAWSGLALITLGMLGVSRVASRIGWRRRMIAAFTVATVFFAVRWANRPVNMDFVDESPDIVTWAVTIAVFMPVVVVAAFIEDRWLRTRALPGEPS